MGLKRRKNSHKTNQLARKKKLESTEKRMRGRRKFRLRGICWGTRGGNLKRFMGLKQEKKTKQSHHQCPAPKKFEWRGCEGPEKKSEGPGLNNR